MNGPLTYLDFFDFDDLRIAVIPARWAHPVRLLGIAALRTRVYRRLFSFLLTATLPPALLRHSSFRYRHGPNPCLTAASGRPTDHRSALPHSCTWSRSNSHRNADKAPCMPPGIQETPVPPAGDARAKPAPGRARCHAPAADTLPPPPLRPA